MAHNLQEMMKDKTSFEKVAPNYNSDNTDDVSTIIREIKLHIEEMEKYQVEFERKIIEQNREHMLKVSNSLGRLRKLIDG